MSSWIKDVEYEYVKLENGGSDSMNVDGSGTPVVFEYESSGINYLERLQLFLLDPGTMSHSSFGAIGTLSSGITYGYTKNGSETVIDTIKSNICLIMNFSDNVNVGNTATGFLNEEDYFFGSVIFPEPIFLADEDTIQFTVNDDLTGISVLKARARIWRKV